MEPESKREKTVESNRNNTPIALEDPTVYSNGGDDSQDSAALIDKLTSQSTQNADQAQSQTPFLFGSSSAPIYPASLNQRGFMNQVVNPTTATPTQPIFSTHSATFNIQQATQLQQLSQMQTPIGQFQQQAAHPHPALHANLLTTLAPTQANSAPDPSPQERRASRTSTWVRKLLALPQHPDLEVQHMVMSMDHPPQLTMSEYKNLRALRSGRNRMIKLRGFCDCHYKDESGERLPCNHQAIGNLFQKLRKSVCNGIECARVRMEACKLLPCGTTTCSSCKGANQLKQCPECNSITSSMKSFSKQCQHCHAALSTQARTKKPVKPKYRDYEAFRQDLDKMLDKANNSGFPTMVLTQRPGAHTNRDGSGATAPYLGVYANPAAVGVFTHHCSIEHDVCIPPADIGTTDVDRLLSVLRSYRHSTQPPLVWPVMGSDDHVSKQLANHRAQNPNAFANGPLDGTSMALAAPSAANPNLATQQMHQHAFQQAQVHQVQQQLMASVGVGLQAMTNGHPQLTPTPLSVSHIAASSMLSQPP
eukprot:TRINITY_DN8950_c0_g1_i3.p1 TRINITY_DN8950_c0_g1~~TRINITY_DN8950_c0_g1_i3.p1  ORF type:complete len:534 (+),score=87.68 TRINITY_DN8950_c0_g1_i3:78-1679(+)